MEGLGGSRAGSIVTGPEEDERSELCEAASIGRALSFRGAKRITGLACNLGLPFFFE